MQANDATLSNRIGHYFLLFLIGALSGIVGTLAHRIGATFVVPYGLIIAIVLIACSSFWARSVQGIMGGSFHLIGASGAIGLLMGYGPGGDVLIPVTSTAFTSFFDNYAGIIWLIASLVVQVVMIFLPSKLFADKSLIPVQAAVNSNSSGQRLN